MLDCDDEYIIIASTLIALESKGRSNVKQLCKDVYEISANVGSRKFSSEGFDNIFLPLSIPTLINAGCISISKNNGLKSSDDIEINLDSICSLTRKTSKDMKKIRDGNRMKKKNSNLMEIYETVYKIINGHMDEECINRKFQQHIRNNTSFSIS